ncbi:MAG: hypothetical protein JSV88_32015 [Candidatus Aminicenantes bacterium]|nr:MAG: hypothetical protein JSV88_32015 [Candidatus Aminicenantes bacterium]
MKKRMGWWRMFRCAFLLFLFVFCPAFTGSGYASHEEGLAGLAEKAANSISGYFSDKYNIKTAVVKFENTAGVSDLTAQRFYQLLVSRLETAGNLNYSDLMINFHQNKGEFNLNRIHPLNHLIYLKLTRDKNKIGAGMAIFSRTLDKIVFIKYIEELFTAGEREIFNTTHFGFKNTGFAKIMEMEANGHLLDLKSFLDQKGRLRFLFYYPEKIELFKLEGNQLIKVFSYPLQWEKPYYPVMEYEGKLCVFFQDNQLYITVGGNFSRYAKILVTKEADTGEVTQVDTIDFIPFRRIGLNNSEYLAGARCVLGKNYFQNKLILLPLQAGPGEFTKERYFIKEVTPFYSLDFSTTSTGVENTLNSVHIVDRDYRYRFLGDNFEELTVEEAERGAALCCLKEQWLAISDFSSGSDRLYFYTIENGSRRLVFQNQINGEIVFISDGLWKAAPGFWVYIKQLKPKPATPEYQLQFWSKKSE